MKQFIMRSPRKADASEIHAMLQPYKPYVGTNPLYTYLLICEHFSKTSIVTENGKGEIVAFASAYHPPAKPDTLFLWEIAVKEGFHGNNLYIRMVREICRRTKPGYIEATVNPSNDSSIKRLEQLAEIFDCGIASDTLFPSGCFGDIEHEDEVLFRLGPVYEDTVKLAKSA